MHELYELKEKLCRELKKYSGEEVTTNSLEIVDKLSHSIKNLDKIIEKYEEDEGNSYGYNSYEGSYRNNRSNRGTSNARGRGRNAKRDSMGRYSNEGYSRNGDVVNELRELMMEAPNEKVRNEYQRVIDHIESDM